MLYQPRKTRDHRHSSRSWGQVRMGAPSRPQKELTCHHLLLQGEAGWVEEYAASQPEPPPPSGPPLPLASKSPFRQYNLPAWGNIKVHGDPPSPGRHSPFPDLFVPSHLPAAHPGLCGRTKPAKLLLPLGLCMCCTLSPLCVCAGSPHTRTPAGLAVMEAGGQRRGTGDRLLRRFWKSGCKNQMLSPAFSHGTTLAEPLV